MSPVPPPSVRAPAAATPAADAVTRLAASLAAAPVALLTWTDGARRTLASAHGVRGAEEGLPDDFDDLAGVVAASGAPLVLRGADALRGAGSRLPDRAAGAAYAAVPVVGSDGRTEGVLAVLDREPRPWTDAMLAQLSALAVLAAGTREAAAPPTAVATWGAPQPDPALRASEE